MLLTVIPVIRVFMQDSCVCMCVHTYVHTIIIVTVKTIDKCMSFSLKMSTCSFRPIHCTIGRQARSQPPPHTHTHTNTHTLLTMDSCSRQPAHGHTCGNAHWKLNGMCSYVQLKLAWFQNAILYYYMIILCRLFQTLHLFLEILTIEVFVYSEKCNERKYNCHIKMMNLLPIKSKRK